VLGQTEPVLVAFNGDIRPENGAGLFFQPRSPHEGTTSKHVMPSAKDVSKT